MSVELLYVGAGIGICGMGLFGFLLHRHLLRRILAFNLLGSGAFLLLVGLAQDGRGVDPVPQALVLTGIVVAFAATALALALIRRWYRISGRSDLPDTPPE